MRRWLWVLLLVVPFLIAVMLSQTVHPFQFQLGTTNDAVVLDDFFTVESNDTETYRWAQDKAAITWPSQMLPGVLWLRGSPAPNGSVVALALPSGHEVTLPSQQQVMLRQHALFVPQQTQFASTSRLHLVTRQAGPAIEDRPINLVVTALALQPINRGWRWPPLLPWLIVSLIPVAFTALLHEFRVPGRYIIGLLVGISVSLTWAWSPLWAFTWIGPFLLVLVGAWLLLRWLRWSTLQVPMAEAAVLVMLVFGAFFAGFQYIKYGDYTSLSASVYWRHWPLWVALAALAAPTLAWPARRRLWIGLLAVLVAYAGFKYAHVFARDYADDFKVLFRGPRAFLQGQPLYDIPAIQTNVLSNLYKYPPFFVFVMGPLTGLPFVPAIQTWRAINLLLMLLSGLILWRSAQRPLRAWSTAGLLALLAIFQPPYDTLRYGQVDLLLLAVLAGALWALVNQRWRWWGALLALATAIKLYPAYLILVALVKRQWHAVAAFTVAGLGLAALSIGLLGWNVHAIYLQEVLPISGAGTAWIENQTINGFITRLYSERIALEPITTTSVRLLTYAGLALLTALTWWRSRTMTAPAAFGLWMVALLIVIPAAWIHYQAILIIPFYQWLVRMDSAESTQPWRVLGCYALAWALLAVGNQWTFFDRLYFGPVWATLLSYKLYGLLLLWGAIAWDPSAAVATNVVSVARTSSATPATHPAPAQSSLKGSS